MYLYATFKTFIFILTFQQQITEHIYILAAI
jgi:hypothetical protein